MKLLLEMKHVSFEDLSLIRLNMCFNLYVHAIRTETCVFENLSVIRLNIFMYIMCFNLCVYVVFFVFRDISCGTVALIYMVCLVVIKREDLNN